MRRENVIVTGAGGFVANYVIQELLGAGKKVRALLHSPARAAALQKLGCEIAFGDVRDAASLKSAFKNVDGVIHLVGIIREQKGLTFEEVVTEGTRNVVAATQNSEAKIIFNSALNAHPEHKNPYMKTKGEAEEIVRTSDLPYTIFQCPYIYGPGGGFINLLANMVNFPVVPVFGTGNQRSQPVYAGDVGYCLAAAIDNAASDGKSLAMVGPDIVTYNELIDLVAEKRGRKARKMHLSARMSRIAVTAGENAVAAAASAPIIKRLFKNLVGVAGETVMVPVITRQELALLDIDMVGEPSPVQQIFGIELTPLAKGLDLTFNTA